MSRTFFGSLVGRLTLLALLAPSSHAAGRPATVTVRVEGPDGRLVLEQVRTSTRPVAKDGEHACSGTSAAGALERATGGRWSASYSTFGYFLTGVAGVQPASSAEYWAVWRNGRASMTGLCDTELENGDELLLFICRPGPDFSCANRPLGLSLARVRAGVATVRVVALADDGTARPAAGATVSGGRRPVETDRRGRATVRLRAGQTTLLATRTGDVPSAPIFCADGRCGAADRVAPTVRVTGIRNGAVVPARRAPRALRGVAIDPAGVRVALRLTRRAGGACHAFDGRRERFVPCARARARWVVAGDRRRWSYLLPARLAPGHYRLAVRATDGHGNARTVTTTFRVEATR